MNISAHEHEPSSLYTVFYVRCGRAGRADSDSPWAAQILEDFLYITFTSMQYVAMVRANAIIDLVISRPLRWLSSGNRLSKRVVFKTTV